MIYLLLFSWIFQFTDSFLGIEVFDANRGFDSPVYYQTFQDDYNNFWVASEVGLFRYDGLRVRKFSKNEGLSNEILDIFPIHRDTILVTSFNGSLFYVPVLEPSKSFMLESPDDGTSTGFVTSAFQDEKGMVLGTSGGWVFEKKGNLWRKFVIQDKRESNFRILHIRRVGENLIAATSAGLWRISENGEVERISEIRFTSKGSPALDGGFLIANTSGVFHVDNERVKLLFEHDTKGARNLVGAVEQTSDSTMWISYLGDGISKFEFQNGEWKEREHLFSGQIITSLEFDGAHHLWVGSKEQRFYRISTNSSRPRWMKAKKLESLGENAFFVTNTSGKMVSVYRNHVVLSGSNDTSLVELPYGDVQFARLISENELLVSSTFFTLIIDINSPKNLVTLDDFFQKNEIQTPIKDVDVLFENVYAISTPNGVFVIDVKAGKVISRYSGRSTAVKNLGGNELLFGTPNSLMRWNWKENEILEHSANSVSLIAPFKENIFVIGSNTFGIQLFENSSKKVITPAIPEGLSNINWTFGNYFGSFLGLIGAGQFYLLDVDSLEVKLDAYPLPFTSVPYVVRGFDVDNGALNLATSSGILHIPSPFENDSKVAIPRISEIYINEIEFAPKKKIDIDAGVSTVRLILAHSDWRQNSRYTFESYNDGLQQWIALSGSEFLYERSSAGVQNFRFRTVESISRETLGEIRISVNFRPHWWETVAARFFFMVVIFALVGGAGAGISYWQRERNYKRLQRQVKYQELERVAITKLLTSHYLFNALSTIRMLSSKGEARQVSDYIVRFSKLIRSLIERSSNVSSSLHTELEWVENYVRLESQNYEQEINLNITYSNSFDSEFLSDEVFVPSFLLQPVVENAILYGNLNQRVIEIHIDYSPEDRLVIEVKNEVNTDARSKNKTSKGLELLSKRMQTWAKSEGSVASLNSKKVKQSGRTFWISSFDLPVVIG